MTPPKSHRCPVHGCAEVVTSGYLMCRKHWLQLPLPLKETVSQSWGDLKNCREPLKRPGLEVMHRAAITMAIRFFRQPV